GSGRIDVLCISQDGSLTLCEAKLERNPDIRRTVLGQILAYAASLSGLDFTGLDERWRTRAGLGLAESILGEGADPDALERFLDAVIQNLTSGRFPLVLAVDSLTDELRRTITYLARHTTTDRDLIGLELAYARRGEVEILVPR